MFPKKKKKLKSAEKTLFSFLVNFFSNFRSLKLSKLCSIGLQKLTDGAFTCFFMHCFLKTEIFSASYFPADTSTCNSQLNEQLLNCPLTSSDGSCAEPAPAVRQLRSCAPRCGCIEGQVRNSEGVCVNYRQCFASQGRLNFISLLKHFRFFPSYKSKYKVKKVCSFVIKNMLVCSFVIKICSRYIFVRSIL